MKSLSEYLNESCNPVLTEGILPKEFKEPYFALTYNRMSSKPYECNLAKGVKNVPWTSSSWDSFLKDVQEEAKPIGAHIYVNVIGGYLEIPNDKQVPDPFRKDDAAFRKYIKTWKPID